jgi:hypothetical protein
VARDASSATYDHANGANHDISSESGEKGSARVAGFGDSRQNQEEPLSTTYSSDRYEPVADMNEQVSPYQSETTPTRVRGMTLGADSLNMDMNMEQLRAEVKRLKEHVHRLENTDGAMAAAAAQTLGQLAAMTFPGSLNQEGSDYEAISEERPKRTPGGKRKKRTATHDMDSGTQSDSGSPNLAGPSRKRRKAGDRSKVKRDAIPTSDTTGKRLVIKERTDQLAVRERQRTCTERYTSPALEDTFR